MRWGEFTYAQADVLHANLLAPLEVAPMSQLPGEGYKDRLPWGESRAPWVVET
jgi:hypothetical protein